MNTAAFHDRASQYYCSRYGWTKKDFDKINWMAVDKAMKMCSSSTRAWASKFSCGFIGTTKMLSRREYWLDNKCPRCGECDEICIHILQCPSPSHREQMLRKVDDFDMWLKTKHVDPDMVSGIIMVTNAWIKGEQVVLETILTPTIQQQYQIGWDHFILGRLCTDITVHLHDFYKSKSSKWNAQSVTAHIIRWLWTSLTRPAWNDRNAYVHSHSGADKSKRLLENMKIEVRELYDNTDTSIIGYSDRQLFDTDIDELLQRSQKQLIAWIQSVESAIRHASRSATVIADPTQPHLNFAPPQSIEQPNPTITLAKKYPYPVTRPILPPSSYGLHGADLPATSYCLLKCKTLHLYTHATMT